MSIDTYHTGRTERVAQYLATEGTPRTLAQIRAGIGADKESSKSLHTMLRRLVQHGRVDFVAGQQRGGNTYCANARTRYVRGTATPAPRKRHPAKQSVTTHNAAVTPAQKANPAVAACRSDSPEALRQQIAADLREFIARGGRIQRLLNGDSAFNREAHNEAAWKTRQEAITAG